MNPSLSLHPCMEDYYKVLGLGRGASLKDISAAYRSLALIYHPDKRKSSSDSSLASGEDADEQFHRVKAAYQALQDPKVRAELDLYLIGLEERRLRDAQMSAQRRKLRDDLLRSEKEASEAQNRRKNTVNTDSDPPAKERTKTTINVKDREACLKLKIKKTRNNEDLNNHLILDMIKADLSAAQLCQIYPLTASTCVAEFSSPQDAFNALCRIQRADLDLISEADWLDGKPPSTIIVSAKTDNKSVETSSSTAATESKPKFSKDLENSVLEKLRLKKLQQQQQQQQKEKEK